MNCSICGAQIPMGQPNCPNCGAMVQQAQPVQPMGGYQQPMQQAQPMQPMGGYQQPMQQAQPMQPMGGYQQPMQPMGGYQQPMQQAQPMGGGVNVNGMVGALKGDVMKIVSLVGALLIAINPFITWCKYEIEYWGFEQKDSANMFGLAGGDTGEKIFILLGILLVLSGLALMMWDLADYVPQFAAIKAKVAGIPYFELILAGVALLAIIIGLCNGTVNDVIELADEMGKGSHGAGPVLGIIGVLAVAAPRVLNMLGIKIGK
ncbi:MAG: hypothetical protein IKJ73_00895 [Lachnospiraceae bacterium]|nr:hypothetical protein [Lachnospiraceae bacterium]